MNKKNNYMDGYSLIEKMCKVCRCNWLIVIEQVLFYELVVVCNSEGWEDVFSCFNIELCFSLNIDEKIFIWVCLFLINVGLVYYKLGKGKWLVGLYFFCRKFKDDFLKKDQIIGDILVVLLV